MSDDTACNSATGDLNTGLGASGFAAARYWSSTEVSATNVHLRYFGPGGGAGDNKAKSITGGRSVRPIRAF